MSRFVFFDHFSSLYSQYSSVPELPGSHKIESFAAKISHFALYAFMGIMPASGVAMGYYGGKGLPFFATSFKGIENTPDTKTRNGAIAKQVGVLVTLVVTVHFFFRLNILRELVYYSFALCLTEF